MLLSDSYIKLRALEPDDIDNLYKWENTSSLWVHGNTLAPYSRHALRKYINETQLSDIYESKQLRLMIDLTNTEISIGAIDLYDFDVRNKRAGVGIIIDEAFRNQRYASKALSLIKEYAFNFLGLHQLYAHIAEKNHTSLNLFQHAGYQESGIMTDWIQTSNGTFENVIILQLLHTK